MEQATFCMKKPFLIGKKVYLRALEPADLEGDYFQWLNDPEVTRFMESGLFPNSREKMERYLSLASNREENVILAIIDKKSDQHIGNVRLGPIHWIHRVSNFGIMIGNKKFWGKGYGAEATRLMAEYAFTRLNLNKINLGVVAEHQAAVEAYKRVGFKKEGLARSQFHDQGKYLDCLYMGLLRKEFESASKSR